MARVNSEDASSAKGGDLGWINPGDTVPEFEQAMTKLAVGEASAPVRTPFGWHLIKVEERRKQDITQDRQREQARQALRQRKATSCSRSSCARRAIAPTSSSKSEERLAGANRRSPRCRFGN